MTLISQILCEHCDYTFETLKGNLPKALESVSLHTIQLGEHRTWRWIEAYKSERTAKEAQLQVQQFSSKKYKSHHRVPETVACLFDVQS